MTQAEVRLQARKLLRDSASWLFENGWTKNAMWRDSEGDAIEVEVDQETQISVPILGAKPESACMVGSIHLNACSYPEVSDAELLLAQYIQQKLLADGTPLPVEWGPYDGIDAFNDLPETSLDDVIDAMTSAAEMELADGSPERDSR